jgi:SAM-dependent methyltransferase
MKVGRIKWGQPFLAAAGFQPASPSDAVNRAVYFAPGVERRYLSRELTKQESAALARSEAHYTHRDVLDIGVGAGRTAHFLAPRAHQYEAIDYSPVMVDYVRRKLPDISVRQADFRELPFADAAFDFVFATDNVIDALSHADRLRALSEAARVLRPGGAFVFSTHNLRYRGAFDGPRLEWAWHPKQLAKNVARYALGRWNHVKVGGLRTVTKEYALLNDQGHFYACLHYYAARDTVRLQLANVGLRVESVFGRDGRMLADADDDREHSSLVYCATAEPA